MNGNQALIELGDFISGQVRDDYSVDVQVVCKVKDSDVLHGMEKHSQMKLNYKQQMDKR